MRRPHCAMSAAHKAAEAASEDGATMGGADDVDAKVGGAVVVEAPAV